MHGWERANRYSRKYAKTLEYDFYYIDDWSFVLDPKVIIMTLFSKTAYLSAR
jgi:lipopolysaccharide/colanic/teichoic acid biosynthesis glycosyltransferase